MFCKNCGAENDNSSKYCMRCGSPLNINDQEHANVQGKKKYKSPYLLLGMLLVICILAVIAVFIFINLGNEKEYEQQLVLGEKYLTEMKYEDAILAYEDAVEIQPRKAKAYIGLSDVYVVQTRYVEAQEVLEQAPVEKMNKENRQMIEEQQTYVQEIIEESEETNNNGSDTPEDEAQKAYEAFLDEPENADVYYKIVDLGPDDFPVLLIGTTMNVCWEFQADGSLNVHDMTVQDEGWTTQNGADYNKVKLWSYQEPITVEQDGGTAQSCDIYYYKDGEIVQQVGEDARYIYDVVM
ncbi:MAG: DUF2203 family protein, partial [Clostridia bacterium]|nr:DUF2203 family protein [Clostridia bacterium]